MAISDAPKKPKPLTGYGLTGGPVEVPAGTPLQQWKPDTAYGGTNYFEAPPPDDAYQQGSGGGSSMLAPSPKPAAQPSVQGAYQNYLAAPAPAPAPQMKTAPNVSSSVNLSPLNDMIAQLRAQTEANTGKQAQERAAMRELLMGRIGQASSPVNPTDPGIKGILATQRLARQRAEERQRSQAAAKYAGEGLLDSGAFDTALSGIEQARGEGEAGDIADVMGQEHQAKRQELQQLLQMALASDDAEAVRSIQQQLAALGAATNQVQIGEGGRQFNEGLKFQKSSFLDRLGGAF
jgi:hypothetical protein